MRLCFELIDYNDNKSICMQDLAKFNDEFSGVCIEVAEDYANICTYICSKKKHHEKADLPNFDYLRGEVCIAKTKSRYTKSVA